MVFGIIKRHEGTIEISELERDDLIRLKTSNEALEHTGT
jgi:hypothetical protein